MVRKRSQHSRDWQQEMRMRGRTLRVLSGKRLIAAAPPSEEYLQELRRQAKDLEPATQAEVSQRVLEQDLRYWQLLSEGLPMTKEWKKYGEKNFERIKSRKERI